ncbi:hypothetical protein [Algoriphagus confluentis]|uniref:hypothetical protein n=1 Tax=Algoriphagus confluentis TaxID=1697556 RepID=UPI0030C67FD5
MEALNNGAHRDSLLHERNYPIKDTGYYIQDPQFGNLVRDAREIGFHLFAYEATGGEDGKYREISQAKNIQAMLEARPKEKFLIHVGFDHALEGIHNSWEKAMAARLTEYTGIDPFTVDQVMYSEKGNFNWSHPLLKAMEISQSTVLIGKDGIPLGYRRGEAYTDLAVLHPKSAFLSERPSWIFDDFYKKVEITIPKKLRGYPQMVLAYKKGENVHTGIPIDIVEIKSKDESCVLALKPGVYDLIITNKKFSFKMPLVVEDQN